MREGDINTQINTLAGPISTDDQIRLNNQIGFQQPFIANQHRILRHTAEIEKSVANGYVMLFIILFSLLVGAILVILLIILGFKHFWPGLPVIILLFIFQIICSKGFFTNTPNIAHVITYFGKVNDKTGNPIMVGCIVVWKVKDTAKAFFDVQNYRNYVRVQTETAIRYIGCKYPYEKINKDDICLRSGHAEINEELKRELTERLDPSGIEIVESYINELSYAPEIANVMLKRQGAQAIIAAREKIVQGAVSIAGHAVQSLKENNIVELNDDEKSDIVSNLILVLCTEADVRPVVNAGAGALS